jgi:hypothetical protein
MGTDRTLRRTKMGSYINPANQSKESWLEENGTWSATPKTVTAEPGCLPVCLINNVMFTAAGIAYNDHELKAFSYNDGRSKLWYWVEVEKLLDPNVSDLHFYKDRIQYG